MKQGWEYKKLGEVASFFRGLTYSGKDEVSFSNNIVLRSNNIDLNTNTINFDELKFISDSIIIPKDKKLKKNSIFMCMSNGSKLHLGKVAFIDKEYPYAFGGFMGLIVPKEDELMPKMAYYYFCSQKFKTYLSSIGNGANINNIKFVDIAKDTIPIPPKSTQLSIVSELDKINELIRLKKGQLKDYDSLAQSIFYEMFGDPVENDKGWEVKELGQLCEVTSSKRVFINEVVDAGVPFIRGTELTALNKLVPGEKMHYTLFITQEHYERLKAITGVPKVGDLLIPSINADGIVWMVDTEKPLYFKDGRVLWIHVNHNHFNSIAIQKLMNILIKNIYASMGGATFAELKLFVLRNMKVPIPPLSVQDAFAEKIKRIDIQKLQVKKSITDLETLLASRMQYWFE